MSDAPIPHWHRGQAWSGDDGGRVGDVFDPATGAVARQVPLASAAQVDEVVAAAVAAAADWRSSSLTKRAKTLFAFRELLVRHTDDIAALITAEHGKVLDDARGEVARGLEVVEFACGIPHLLKGSHSESVSTGTDSHSVRQPVGVAAGITPFNFPAMVPLWMFPIAIACGNAFVLKPSERDPSASVRLAELFTEAGLPDGVLSVVHGDREAVDTLLTHPSVGAVSFVGSTPVARHVFETAAISGKRVQALGGAKNHMVVLADADLGAAADAAVSAGYGSAGERCMAISVVVAADAIADELVAKIAERTRTLRVGAGTAEGSDLGPLITAVHRDRVAGYVEAGVEAGAELVVDGRDPEVAGGAGDGFFLGPCLFDRVDPSMSIYTDEIFGPVLCVVRTSSLADAVALINANPYGNGVALFTRDGAAARWFEAEVEVGMVGINVPIPVPMAFYSFGGWGQSLFGDTHVHGPEGVSFYTRGKVVTTRWGVPAGLGTAPSSLDLHFPTNR